jgi:hypothetical protein
MLTPDIPRHFDLAAKAFEASSSILARYTSCGIRLGTISRRAQQEHQNTAGDEKDPSPSFPLCFPAS